VGRILAAEITVEYLPAKGYPGNLAGVAAKAGLLSKKRQSLNGGEEL
jgi:hypothetical protein